MAAATAYSGAADFYNKRVAQYYDTDDVVGYTQRQANMTPALNLNSGAQQTTVGPMWSSLNKGIKFGVPLSTNWINSTACAAAVHARAGTSICSVGRDAYTGPCDSSASGDSCETGWCGALGQTTGRPATDPAPCSNSPAFAEPVFGSIQFTNAAPFSVFASAVVAVTPSYADADGVVQGYNVGLVPATLADDLDGSRWAGKLGTQTLNSAEQGDMTCFAGAPASRTNLAPYVYGAGSDAGTTPLIVAPSSTLASGIQARALRGGDTVSFELCKLHQQLAKCQAGDAVCNGTHCCDVGASTGFACANFAYTPPLGYCSRFSSSSTNSNAFKPWPQYFNVVRGGGAAADVACAGTDDGQSCVFFGGVTNFDAAGAGGAMFAYEPNPHRNPANFATGGPVLGVPVKFSLMYSADGTDPATGSYLSQFVSNLDATSTTTTTVAATYATQAGFLALGDFGVRSRTMLSSSGSSGGAGADAYVGFSSAYFAYAVVQRFLLQFYGLAPLVHLGGAAHAVFALFSGDDDWAASVCGVWNKCAPTTGTAGVAVNSVAGQVAQGVFLLQARPVVAPGATAGTVLVTLTVPSLLLTAWPPSALLLAMFPTTLDGFTVPGGGTTMFPTAETWGAVANGPATSAQTGMFPVVGSAGQVVEYFAVTVDGTSTNTPVPATTGGSPAGSGSASSAVVGARVTFTVSAVAARSVTLLFYLYCAANAVPLDPACVADLAVQLVPATVDGSNVCSLASACTTTGFSGSGSSALNALFATANSTVCKCLYPQNAVTGANTALAGGATASGAFMNVPAMCFNRFCTSVDIDLASIAATEGCSKTSPVGGAALDCAAMCDQYVNLLGASSDFDASALDVAALRDTCGVDVSQQEPALPRYPVFVTTLALLAVCVPLFVAAFAACTPRAARASLASPLFWVPAMIAFLVCCAAVTYALVDLRGVASCSATDYRDGTYWPSSTCKSAGFFGRLPSFTLPPSFCASRSYCVCGASGTGTCSSQCAVCSADGLCGTTAGTGARVLMLENVDTKFDPLMCAFSGSLVAFLVPACVAVFCKCAPAFRGKAAVAVLLGLFLVAVSSTPMLVQARVLAVYRTRNVGVVSTVAEAACT